MKNVILMVYLLFISSFSFNTGISFAGKPDPCLGIGIKEASMYLNVPPSRLQKVSTPVMPERCVIRSTNNFFKAICFSVYRENSIAEASKRLNEVMKGLKMLSPVENIKGLGDEAYYFPDERLKRMLIRKKNIFIDISMPKDNKIQEKLGKDLLSRL